MELINSNEGNIEGFQLPSYWEGWNDEYQNTKDRDLQDKKGDISEKTVALKGDISELRNELNAEKIALQDLLKQYEDQKGNPNAHQDRAAEPLKDETLKFSNYSYVPLAYYPIGCLFILFLIYKKL
tara:strand:- start:2001 stop:2378 length:378 start_codon:yes stop_codon:yes gene_type:complete